MTAELKEILDTHIQWCRKNPELCEISLTDINMKNVNMLCDMYLSVYPPDQNQPTKRTATEAAEIFMDIVGDMSETTGMDIRTTFVYLLNFTCGPDSINSFSAVRTIDHMALSFMFMCARLIRERDDSEREQREINAGLIADDGMKPGDIIPVLPRGSIGARYLDPFKLAIINIPHYTGSQ